MPIRIRKATLQDYEPICAVLTECDRLHSEQLPERFRPPAAGQVARTREYIASLIDDPQTAVLVATQAGQIVGALVAVLRDTLPMPILTPRRVATIEIIAVRQDQQGRGAGRALMKKAEQWARAKGADDIELTVFLFNAQAIRFYTELGLTAFSQKMGKHLR